MIQQVLVLSCFLHNKSSISAAVGVFFEEGTQESPWPLDSKQPEWELVVMICAEISEGLDTPRRRKRYEEMLYPIFVNDLNVGFGLSKTC